MAYETFDIDFLAGKVSEDALARLLISARFENKRDFWAKITGNIAVEYEYKNRSGEIKPSGISITTAEWWSVELENEVRVVAPTEFVKGLARAAISQGKHKWIGDGNNHHNALVPFKWFLVCE